MATGWDLHRFPHGFAAQRALKAPLGLLQELVVVTGHGDFGSTKADKRQETVSMHKVRWRLTSSLQPPDRLSLLSSCQDRLVSLATRSRLQTSKRSGWETCQLCPINTCYCYFVFKVKTMRLENKQARRVQFLSSVNTDSLMWTKAPAPICLARISHAHRTAWAGSNYVTTLLKSLRVWLLFHCARTRPNWPTDSSLYLYILYNLPTKQTTKRNLKYEKI